jgi:hypothetical protein
MQNWSSWQGYGCLTYACTGVYIPCRRAVSIPIGCAYTVTTWPSTDKSVLLLLGLFAPICAQDEQIRSAAHKVLPAALILLEQYHDIILMLQKQLWPSNSLNVRFAQQRKIALKTFLEAADHFKCFDPLTTTQVNFIRSFILTRLPSSAKLELHFSHFACLTSYEGYTLQDTFFFLTFIKERILCKILSQSVIKGRKHVCISSLLHFNSPDLNF